MTKINRFDNAGRKGRAPVKQHSAKVSPLLKALVQGVKVEKAKLTLRTSVVKARELKSISPERQPQAMSSREARRAGIDVPSGKTFRRDWAPTSRVFTMAGPSEWNYFRYSADGRPSSRSNSLNATLHWFHGGGHQDPAPGEEDWLVSGGLLSDDQDDHLPADGPPVAYNIANLDVVAPIYVDPARGQDRTGVMRWNAQTEQLVRSNYYAPSWLRGRQVGQGHEVERVHYDRPVTVQNEEPPPPRANGRELILGNGTLTMIDTATGRATPLGVARNVSVSLADNYDIRRDLESSTNGVSRTSMTATQVMNSIQRMQQYVREFRGRMTTAERMALHAAMYGAGPLRIQQMLELDEERVRRRLMSAGFGIDMSAAARVFDRLSQATRQIDGLSPEAQAVQAVALAMTPQEPPPHPLAGEVIKHRKVQRSLLGIAIESVRNADGSISKKSR